MRTGGEHDAHEWLPVSAAQRAAGVAARAALPGGRRAAAGHGRRGRPRGRAPRMLARRIIPCLDVAERPRGEGRALRVAARCRRPGGAGHALRRRGRRRAGVPRHHGEPRARATPRSTWWAAWPRRLFIPFTVGGGIRTVEDAGRAAARRRRQGGGQHRGGARPASSSAGWPTASAASAWWWRWTASGWRAADVVMVTGGRDPTEREAVEWAARGSTSAAPARSCSPRWTATARRSGYDLPLTSAAAAAVRIPVIASGGAGTLERTSPRRSRPAPMACWRRRSSTSAAPRSARPAPTCASGATRCDHDRPSSLPWPPRCWRRRALHAAAGTCRRPAPCVRLDRAGTEVRDDMQICPGRYRIADPKAEGRAGGGGVRGAARPVGRDARERRLGAERFTGYGRGAAGAWTASSITGGTIRGYRFGIAIEGGRGHRCGAPTSRSRATQALALHRLDCTTRRDWLDIFHPDTAETYGAGLLPQGAPRAIMVDVTARDAQNGILLHEVREAQVSDNDVSRNSGWGIALWRSSHNVTRAQQGRLQRALRRAHLPPRLRLGGAAPPARQRLERGRRQRPALLGRRLLPERAPAGPRSLERATW